MKKLVVVVEDDELASQLYQFYFQRYGIKSFISDNASEVIDFVKREKVGLLIMDINLTNTYIDGKKVDGLEFTKYLKNNEITKHIPIMYVTGTNIDYDKQTETIYNDSVDVITKPIINFKSFIQKINRYLEL
jgi:CheY-like chemotaxis protein